MDTMLRDLNSKLRGLDDIKDSLKHLDSLHQSKTSFKNIISSPKQGQTKSTPPTSKKKIGKTPLKTPQTTTNPKPDSKSWQEILPTSPPTPNPKPQKQSLTTINAKNSSPKDIKNFSVGSTGKWWEDIRAAQKNSQQVDDCLDDIDREFEELEKMIDACDIGSSNLM
jgi:hypothetical protein